MNRFGLKHLLYLFSAVLASAATTVTGQTSQPAVVPGSPKAALLDYDKALHAGDGAGIRAMLATTNPTEERVATVMVDSAVTMADLSKKARSKFGTDSANAAFGDPDDMSQRADEAVGKATETVTGDTAIVVANPGPQGTIHFQKVDGKWKLSITASLAGADPDKVQKALDDSEKANAVIKQFTADMDAGKFTTAESAKQTFNERIYPVKAEMKKNMETGPSTKPS